MMKTYVKFKLDVQQSSSKYNLLRRKQFKDSSYNLSSFELFELILNKPHI